MDERAAENEVKFIRDEMKSNMSIRTTLLTFSFTSVITTIGFGISKYDIAPFWIYILPIIITIVFSSRITYYKDLQSKMNAYLHVFYPSAVKMDNIYENIDKSYCARNKIQSFLINYELLILSIVCCIVYYLKLDIIQSNIINICVKDKKMIFFIILPVILLVFQYSILHKVPSYHKRTKKYMVELQGRLSQTTINQGGLT